MFEIALLRPLPGSEHGGAGQKAMARRLEFLKGLGMIDGKATAYVCENYVCQLPTNDLLVMMKLVEEKKPSSIQQKGKIEEPLAK